MTRTGFDTFSSAATVFPVMLEVYEIEAGSESTPPTPPRLGRLQASAWAVLTDVGDITAHQSSFDKSPFDTAHTIVSL